MAQENNDEQKHKENPVLQYDRNGVCLQRFVSIAEAQRQTKTWGISAKCRGERKQTGEYIWRYEKEVDD